MLKDYVGQRRAERAFQYIVSAFALIGFAWGFHVQQFSQTLMILGVGIVVSSLAILPPWPFWKRNQLKWKKPVPKDDSSVTSKSADQYPAQYSAASSTTPSQSPKNKKNK